MNTQLTVPEKKSYAWEGLVRIGYGRARQIAAGMRKIKNPLIEALDEAQGLGKKLNGSRLKQVVIAVAQQESWYPTPPPSHYPRVPRSTDDPNVRRCAKCGVAKQLADFTREASDKQKVMWKYSRTLIDGQDLALQNPSFFRGYERPARRKQVVCVVCNECFHKRHAPRPDAPTCEALRKRLRVLRRRTDSAIFNLRKSPDAYYGEQKIAFLLYKREVLRSAASKLRELKRSKTTRYPRAWPELLTAGVRAQYEQAFNSVPWTARPQMW